MRPHTQNSDTKKDTEIELLRFFWHHSSIITNTSGRYSLPPPPAPDPDLDDQAVSCVPIVSCYPLSQLLIVGRVISVYSLPD